MNVAVAYALNFLFFDIGTKIIVVGAALVLSVMVVGTNYYATITGEDYLPKELESASSHLYNCDEQTRYMTCRIMIRKD